jgi:hypothetical protein
METESEVVAVGGVVGGMLYRACPFSAKFYCIDGYVEKIEFKRLFLA